MWRRISSFPLRGVEERLKTHLKLVITAIELLEELIMACEDYNWALVNSAAEKIALIEREADDVKRNAEIGLYKGTIFVGLKEDFLRLAVALDEIADKAKDASRVLASRRPEAEEVKVLFDDHVNIKTMIAETIKIVKHLEIAIVTLNDNANGALKKAQEIEKMEEALDEVKLEILKHLTKNEKKLSTLTYLQLRDFIFMLDMVADETEEASDILTAMIVKSGA